MEDDEDEKKLSATSYGSVDTTAAYDECWMIKVPPKLAQLWENCSEGTDLGELIFTKGGVKMEQNNRKTTIKPSLAVKVDPGVVTSKSDSVPLHYTFQAMTKKIPTMHTFTRDDKDGTVQIHGHVTRTANLQVERQDGAYQRLLKDRLMDTTVAGNQRFVKPVETTESVIHKQQGARKGFGDAVLKFGKRLIEAANNTSGSPGDAQRATKRARQFAPNQSIRSVVFELFGQQRFWSVKDLKAAAVNGGATEMGSRKAEADLRDILREIGEYHRSGDHKNMWELLSEYQNAS